MRIKIPSSLKKTTMDGFEYCASSNVMACEIASLEVTSSYPTMEDFLSFIKSNMKISFEFTIRETQESITYYNADYANSVNSLDFNYCSGVYEFNSRYYMVDFMCETKNYNDKMAENFHSYLDSAVFTNSEEVTSSQK